MILLLFGPPGCGKGTQAAYLAEQFHIPAISTGEMFRDECKTGTPLGKMACTILASGCLLPDEIVDEIVAKRIAQEDCTKGFLLDGYPRTVPQAKNFANLLQQRVLPAPIVIHLDVADDHLVKRLTSRRQCPECKHIYNLLSQPPKVDGICDLDRASLVERDDDREAVILQRLRAYDELTGPILQFYGESSVFRVDGAAPPEQVRQAIFRLLEPLHTTTRPAILTA